MQGQLDQMTELFIVELFPPVGGRPGIEFRARSELGGIAHGLIMGDAGRAGATGRAQRKTDQQAGATPGNVVVTHALNQDWRRHSP